MAKRCSGIYGDIFHSKCTQNFGMKACSQIGKNSPFPLPDYCFVAKSQNESNVKLHVHVHIQLFKGK